MFDFETKLRHLRSLRPTRPGAAGKRSKRQRTTAFEFLEERCCPSTISDLWIGGATGNYSIAANWNNGVPNNTAQTTFDVEIPSSATVSMDITATIGNLTIDAGSSLNIQGGQYCYLTGNLVNQGSIQVGVSGNAARLYAEGTQTNGGTINLSGGGTINLNDPSSYLLGYNGNETLVNTDNVIQGQGYIYNLASFQNQSAGTVDANVSGGTLEILQVPTTNAGTLEATGGGTLYLYASSINDAGDAISTDSKSNIILNDETVNGGSLTAASGAVIHGINNTTLDGVTVTSGTIYSIDGGNYNYLTGDLVNQGTIEVGVNGNAGRLYADLANGTINLSGGGTINLNDPSSYLLGYNGNETLVNTDNVIQGQGYIYNLASFQNQSAGTVDANVSGGTLEILQVPTTNAGTLEATGGGTLYLYASSINDAGDAISTDSKSNIILNDETVNGGSLTAASGAVIHGINNTTLDGVTVTSGTIYSIDGGNYNYLTGDLVNQGTIEVGVNGNAGRLYADLANGTINLSGGGTINLNDPSSYLLGYNGNETLVNTDNVIQGQGYIYNLASFQNQSAGTVDANVSGGTLEILQVPTTNAGTLEATGGGTLYLYASSINDAGDAISTDSKSNIILNDETVNGGSLTAASGAVIHGINNTTLDGVTVTSGTIYSIDGGNYNYLTGDLVNQGTIEVGVNGNAGRLYADLANGTINLSGGGTINLNDPSSYLLGYNGNETLVNTDNVIQGQGYIYNLASFQNQSAGTVDANVSGGTLEILQVPTTNAGTLEATGGGTLYLYASSINDAGDAISTDSKSNIILNDETVNGGSLTAASGAVIHGINNTTLDGVTVTSGTIYSIDGGNYNYLTGDLVNQGTIQVGVSGNAARLYVVPSTVTLSGCGTINLNDPNSLLLGANGNETLQNQGNTIGGPGSVQNLTVVNIPPNPPTATTEAATNITTTGATLNGSVNPNVGETTAWFIYGTDPTLTTGTSSTAAEATDCGCGGIAVPVAAALSGLQPGTTYYDEVVATSAGGTVDGSILSFTTVQEAQAPVVTTQPASQPVTAGQTATFTAAASGNPTPTVQWQVSTDSGSTFSDITGATSTTLTLSNTTTAQNGDEYQAVFTNSVGTATTNAATLTVNTAQFAPSVTTQPASQAVPAGQTATFTAAASGNPTPTVQWQVSTDSGSTFSDITGATSTTLTLSNTTTAQNGDEYQAVFTNSVGTATTNAATLTVNTAQFAPSVTTQPASQPVPAGQTATFTAAASGNPTPTVQWQVSTDSGSTFSDITGATSTTLTLSNTTTAQNGDEYQAVFTNSVGTATTNAATLTVNTAQFAPSVTTQPASQPVTAGQTATFTAAASGNPTPTVQWQVSTDSGSTFSDITGATSTTLTLSNTTTAQNGDEYQAVFTNSVGTATTNAATLTVNTAQFAPSVTTQPASQAVPAGQTATFTAAASGNPTPTVQWQVSTDSGSTFSDITGATSTTLTLSNTTTAQNGDEYQAVFTNSVGTATTNAATLTVNTAQFAPSVTTQPASQPVPAGQTATFTAAASGNPTPTVQWQVSTDSGSTFSDITGATSTTLTLSNTTTAQNGDEYQAVFTNSVGTATTSAATLTVTPSTSATVSAVSVSWGKAGTAALQTAADGLRLLPAGRNTDLPWLGINKLAITLSAAESLSPADVSVTGLTVANYGPVTISGSGTSYTITLAQPINAADRVTVTIGNANITTFTRRLDVLPGDVNDDGVVTAQDAVDVINLIGANQTYSVWADVVGDGVVDLNDYLAVRVRIGTKLPPLITTA